MGATALLYFGPLLAGLGGFGWAVAPVFAVIFMLWLMIIRPQDFPRNLQEWLRVEGMVAFAARTAVQLLLVLVLFGAGRGIGGVLNSLPAFPPMLPIAISFLAIPLARLIWDPWKAHAMDTLLDDALNQIETGSTQNDDRSYAEAVLMPLNGLPDDVSVAELASHLSAIRALVDEAVTFDVLHDRVVGQEASVAGRRAVMVMGSDGAVLERMSGSGLSGRAMMALASEPELLAQMAERLIHSLRQDPDIWGDCPNMGMLEAMHAQAPLARSAISALQAEMVAQAPRD
jgi:hypothetical protein